MIRPRFDRDLEDMLTGFVVDGTTVAAAFFDGQGTLSYPWRKEIEALSGRERHTLRLESRSWAIPPSILVGVRILSCIDLDWARRESDNGRAGAADRHLLAEVHDLHLRRFGRMSIDRLAACLGAAAALEHEHVSRWASGDDTALLATERVLGGLAAVDVPFDGQMIEDLDLECAGLAWGLYEVPSTWSNEHVLRAVAGQLP